MASSPCKNSLLRDGLQHRPPRPAHGQPMLVLHQGEPLDFFQPRPRLVLLLQALSCGGGGCGSLGRLAGGLGRHPDLGPGYPLRPRARGHEHRGHVASGDHGVHPPHGEHEVDVAELQLLIRAEGGKPPPDVEGPGAGEEVAGALQHELGRVDRLPELLHLPAGEDDPRDPRALLHHQRRRDERARDVIPHVR
ncbi:hypothetical protein EUGRSUZ_B02882 [Eucalyptus grandis]|uniref:Uncharacterized protein n=2 Tax=Eucalyptus grandis TaxID=71139 RepID=A0ACC3LUP2_EUCGR|nr:hypothetical protein EUGRSUZ_B02882 [Eucalyptus grandis]